MTSSNGARWSFIGSVLGTVLLAAGAADCDELFVSAPYEVWPPLFRTGVELFGGFWLITGRSASVARIAASAVYGGVLAYDLATAVAGHPLRPIFGRVAIGSGWVVLCDLFVLAGLLRWRVSSKDTVQRGIPPRRLVALLAIAAAFGITIERSQFGQFPIRATVRAGRTSSGLDSLVYLPDGYYRWFRRWPLILNLHGGGESGDNLDLVRHQGLPQRVEMTGGLPFIIVAPQSPDWLWNIGALDILLDEVLEHYRVDPDRVYLVGHSMGGSGTWALAAHRPERFAAIAPICSRGNPALAGRLRDVPTWAFHGAEDRIVPPEESQRMVVAMKDAGGFAQLTVYPGVGHDAWTPTYANPTFFEWLLQHRRGSNSDRSASSPRE
jgi:pimeloyl-ACP methyl ester carboxylesterase